MVSKYHCGLVCGLKQSLQRRMPYYEENETYIVAGILDPHFKLRWCSDDAERAISLDLLKAALERLSPASTVVVRVENYEPHQRRRGNHFLMTVILHQQKVNNNEVHSLSRWMNTLKLTLHQ